MTIPDEKFFAWLDGELSPADAALVEAEVAKSPELTRSARQHRAMQARLTAAFDTVAAQPVPEHLRKRGEVVDFASARRVRDSRRWGSRAQWAAIAATLAVGIFTGMMTARPTGGPAEVHGAHLYAASALDNALDKELASAPATGPVRIGITFRDQSGAICRTFTDAQSSGLACRDSSGWRLRGLFAAPEGQAGTYRMAGGPDPNLAALVDSAMAGEPLDAAQERAARSKGWH